MSEEIMPQDDLETPEPQDAPDEQDKQSEIIKRIRRAEAKGRKEAEQALLESLGLDSVDTIKAVIEAQRQREEAEKSEAERLQAQLEKVKAEKQAAEERLTKIEQEREQAKRHRSGR